MAEDRQFRQRLEAWIRALEQQLFTPVCTLRFSGTFSAAGLDGGDAETRPLHDIPEGTKWGAFREYGLFRAQFTFPEAAEGRRCVFQSGLGGEQLVYVNGRAAGSIDKQHAYVTLPFPAKAGDRVTLLVESFAGNGARLENTVPLAPGKRAVPETPACQQTVRESVIAVSEEETYALLTDMKTLAMTAALLPEDSERRAEIEEALREAVHTADPEAEKSERIRSFLAARERLQPALEKENPADAPVLHLIGQSHIDIAWMWPMEETRHKIRRTYANQLRLMEEYPDYRFLCCEPRLLEMLEETEKDLWQEVQARVKEGRMEADGAFYVECDTNIPSGESLLRQLLWGKRWYREKLGADTVCAWQPDTFGFTAQLPQLLKGFDIPYFATQKLLRADPECERFPYQDFLWEGADGTRVQALSFFKSNARTDPQNLFERWHKHSNPTGDADSQLYPFGFGDGGGGADRDMLEYLAREKNLSGLPRTEWSSLKAYFESASARAGKHVWQGELYLCWHRGTYTVQRNTKEGIKALERALHDAELAVCLQPEEEREKLRDELKSAWRVLLTHQFHDIAAGVGVHCVHEEAETALRDVLRQVRQKAEALFQKAFIAKEEGFTLVNTMPFERREFITLPDGRTGFVTLPPSGSVPFTAFAPAHCPVTFTEEEGGIRAENGLVSFFADRSGRVTAFFDQRNGRSYVKPGGVLNELRLYKNAEPVYDAWELSRDYVKDMIPGAVQAEGLYIKSASPERLVLKTALTVGSSPASLTVTLPADEPCVYFDLDIDWCERHRLLKTHFETGIESENALHGMQFCHVRRPNHDRTAFARDRYEVCSHRYTALETESGTAALLSRDIFGISCRYGDLALTLLRAPCVPDEQCDRGTHHLSWTFRVSDRPFTESGTEEAGEAFVNPPFVLAGRSVPFTGFTAEHALIDTVKPAEEGTAVILHAHEYTGTAQKAVFRFPREYRVSLCRMDETPIGEETVTDTLEISLRPFEIACLRLEESR